MNGRHDEFKDAVRVYQAFEDFAAQTIRRTRDRPRLLAKEMLALGCEQFSRNNFASLVDDEEKYKASHVAANKYFTNVTLMIRANIGCRDNLKDKKRAYKMWVKVLDKCMKQKNYNAAAMVYAALGHNSFDWLAKELSSRELRAFNRYKLIVDTRESINELAKSKGLNQSGFIPPYDAVYNHAEAMDQMVGKGINKDLCLSEDEKSLHYREKIEPFEDRVETFQSKSKIDISVYDQLLDDQKIMECDQEKVNEYALIELFQSRPDWEDVKGLYEEELPLFARARDQLQDETAEEEIEQEEDISSDYDSIEVEDQKNDNDQDDDLSSDYDSVVEVEAISEFELPKRRFGRSTDTFHRDCEAVLQQAYTAILAGEKVSIKIGQQDDWVGKQIGKLREFEQLLLAGNHHELANRIHDYPLSDADKGVVFSMSADLPKTPKSIVRLEGAVASLQEQMVLARNHEAHDVHQLHNTVQQCREFLDIADKSLPEDRKHEIEGMITKAEKVVNHFEAKQRVEAGQSQSQSDELKMESPRRRTGM